MHMSTKRRNHDECPRNFSASHSYGQNTLIPRPLVFNILVLDTQGCRIKCLIVMTIISLLPDNTIGNCSIHDCISEFDLDM